jgi:uncharacterized protein YndB with AHSA1/START domain
MNQPLRTITPAPVRKSIHVDAPPERAFRVFTAGMGRWWKPEHHIAPTPFADIVIEPRAGGRWFERDKDGTECEWGKVIAWDPPRRVVLAWQLDANWQYDANFVTELEIRFAAESGGTRVDLEHRDLEKFGDKAAEVRASLDADSGWNGLLDLYARSVTSSG